MGASELKRCPFCGSRKAKAHHWSDHTSEVICKNCGASFRFERSDDLEETIAAWNRRAGKEANGLYNDIYCNVGHEEKDNIRFFHETTEKIEEGRSGS